VWVVGDVCLVATPVPFFGSCDQSAGDGIAVDGTELFYALSLTKHVEVVVAGLPDVIFCLRAGEALLEDLNGERQGSGFGLGDEKVDVVRHDDEAVDFGRS